MAGQQSRWGRLLSATCCALMLSASLPAHAIVLRTAAQEGTEPKFIADGKGHVVGLCVDILRAVEQIEPTLQFVGDQHWKPLIRAYSEMETGQLDVQCAMQRTAEREQRFHFLGPALYSIDYHFLVRVQDTVNITQWDDVRRLAPDNVVLINRGFAAGEVLAEMGGIEVDANSTNPQLNLQKLIAGRGRLFFHRGPGLQRLLARTGTADKVRILPQVMYSAKLYFVTSKKLAAFINERLERALFQLEKNGELERLMRKWD
ncbi:substrate-binding periplasmic protein [Duganella violaceipulchra]|uniref:ABC-type amino acid transport substrate-binding protein n=1 Tax=Duganella violaceipulchra TaxID=2849652 RepID=A0AA41H4K6_9BURK|nr:ABC transporter substrate-binding protein [Duganella violaceicalia]MBV6321393.1 transporter substrate-binding domain-containing protein [Duganella violaceicalia]MCP2009358.1 ABC-type amino acid transport substrate-binding protein [Duganella violaceicalia]